MISCATVPPERVDGRPEKKCLGILTPSVFCTLNLANRKAAQITKNRPVHQTIGVEKCEQAFTMSMAGATPNVIMSAMESNWAPVLLVLFIRRARRPSKVSSAIATIISHDAITKLWFMTHNIEIKPQAIFPTVIKIGNVSFILTEIPPHESAFFG